MGLSSDTADFAVASIRRWWRSMGRIRHLHRQAVHVPETVDFATKIVLAKRMIERAVATDMPPRWITANAGYGSDYRFRGETGQATAVSEGTVLVVVMLPHTKRGFALLPERLVVERSFVWMARFRRLVRDYERLSESLASGHWLCCATLMLRLFISETG